MREYQHHGTGIQWNINSFSGDQINIGGSSGGISFGSATPDINSLRKIVIPPGTRQVTVNGTRYEIGGDYYTDGTYETC